MTDSKPKELIEAERHIDNGKYNSALQILDNFYNKLDVSLHGKVSCNLLQFRILYEQGHYDEAILLAKQAHKESLGLGSNILIVDALISIARAVYASRKSTQNAPEIVKEAENQLELISPYNDLEYKERKAYIYALRGNMSEEVEECIKNYQKSLDLFKETSNNQRISRLLGAIGWELACVIGDLNKGLEYADRALTVAKESGVKYEIASALRLKAGILAFIGEVDLSIKLYEESLEICKTTEAISAMIITLINLSESYRLKGEIDKAIDCLEESLNLSEKFGVFGGARVIIWNYDFLIRNYIERGNLEKAKYYFNQLGKLKDDLDQKTPPVNQLYLYDKALILKTSPRAINRGKAEEILKELLNDVTIYDIKRIVLIALNEVLITELQLIKNEEVLEELKGFISQLLEIAEKSHSFWLLGETYLLKAKIALISLNVDEARKLLSKAQSIAEKYSLNQLVIKISNEHDNLLKQLELWEKLKETKAPLNERIQLSQLNEQMDIIAKNRRPLDQKLEVEQPVWLAILTNKGNLMMSNPFYSDMNLDDQRLTNFLSSFNTFCDQIFSESFDRVKFGEFTVLIKSVNSYYICYMFQGQTYNARQKLFHFSDLITKDVELQKILEKANKENLQISISEYPYLENLVSESFLASPKGFKMPFKAYIGDDLFLFVSYAHVNRLQVYPIIDSLHKIGINIWYDEGIPISENWKESIVKNLERSSAFLLFVTPHIIESENVRKEISFALKKQKPFIIVYLKETNLPSELMFEIADIQAIMKYLLSDKDFYEKLTQVIFNILPTSN